MKKTFLTVFLLSSTMWFTTGCGSEEPQPNDNKSSAQGFHTDRSYFMTTIDESAPTKEMRNAFLEEYIQKSDIQCSQYLDRSINSPASQANTGLYMALFDTVSQLSGVKPITDTAKELYRSNEVDAYETKMAYKRALSPEIKRGVEIARERYARKMLANRYRLIESYTIPKLNKDLEKYDRLCNYDTGLVEINNILKNARKQKNDKLTPFSPKLKIDPETIKAKVETVTKEEEAKQTEAEAESK